MKKLILLILLLPSLCFAGLVQNAHKAAIAMINAGAGADTTAPTFSSATLAADGDTITVLFSELLDDTALGGDEFTLDSDGAGGADNVLTYSSGDGTSTWVFTTTTTIESGETVTITFDGAANEAEDKADNDLEDFGPLGVTNNSGVGASGTIGDIAGDATGTYYRADGIHHHLFTTIAVGTVSYFHLRVLAGNAEPISANLYSAAGTHLLACTDTISGDGGWENIACTGTYVLEAATDYYLGFHITDASGNFDYYRRTVSDEHIYKDGQAGAASDANLDVKEEAVNNSNKIPTFYLDNASGDPS